MNMNIIKFKIQLHQFSRKVEYQQKVSLNMMNNTDQSQSESQYVRLKTIFRISHDKGSFGQTPNPFFTSKAERFFREKRNEENLLVPSLLLLRVRLQVHFLKVKQQIVGAQVNLVSR